LGGLATGFGLVESLRSPAKKTPFVHGLRDKGLPQEMLSYLNYFPECRVAVIGDLMLDCYLYGDVNRISPEAPVPVVRATSERAVPGGAANVAANLAALGLLVRVVGVTGDDAAREELIERLRGGGEVDCSGVIAMPGRRTTRKLRIIGGHQQMARIDHEDVRPCEPPALDSIFRASAAAIDASDVVILSDYGKGALTDDVLKHVVTYARSLRRPVIVDPKRSDFSAYRGATVITPNRRELTIATGLACESDEEAARAAAKAQQMSGADILLTRSGKGLSYFPQHGEPIHLATVAQNVFDVSGAGDTVVAVLAASMASGVPLQDGMKMANHAAGIVVSKLGTACVTREELAASMAAEQVSPSVDDGRLLALQEAVATRSRWSKDKLTVGLTNGCFDLLHPGHVSLIRRAAENCDRLIVAINSDPSVRRLKGANRPIQDQEARAAVIGAIKGVSAVVIFGEDTPHDLIVALRPDVLIKGADYSLNDVVGADLVQSRGGRVILAQLEDGHSTTKLIASATR
jgi:D-beta-D-heptose 7-phosphate kinase / D-beta-D-heptose 1-phosphate adenosyltransferase